MPRDTAYRSVAGGLSLLVLAVVLAVWGCEQKAASSAAATSVEPEELTILTPHSAKIRATFEEGFWNWHLHARKRPVRIRWIDRGSPQCVEYVRDFAERRARGSREPKPDVMFGGGIIDHAGLATAGLSKPIDLGDTLAGIPAEVTGQPTRDAAGHWFATGLSSFGILYNAEACVQRGVAAPGTWADLAEPRFHGWVALADPRASGSHRECLALILQHEGWERGWGTVLRILANTRALAARSSAALDQVGSGVALATVAVNFEGAARAAESAGRLEYVDPPGATAATPDIVSVLYTAANVELAKDFVRYLLSEEGQALWAVRREQRAPYGDTLYHYALAPAVYEKYAGKLAVDRNPLEVGFGMLVNPREAPLQGALVKLLVRAACEGHHVLLQNIWHELIARDQPAALLAELVAPPCDELTAHELAAEYVQASPDEARQLVETWRAVFADKYARVMQALEQ